VIAIDAQGEGPTLVLVHGVATSRAVWRHVVPELAKQFLWDSMEPAKMDAELSVSQWGPVLNAYLAFDVWKKKSFMKGLVEMSLRGEPEGWPDAFNDAWREQATNTTIAAVSAAAIWVGPNCHLVHYPLRGGEQYNIVVTFHSRQQGEWGVREGSRDEVMS